MTWSYQDTMPRDIDKVRFYLGDTVSADPLLSDQEIEFALSEAGSPRGAAVLCANRLAAQWSRLADLKEGQLSISYSQKSAQMLAIGEAITDSSAVVDPAMPSAGGVFVADKVANEQDDTLVAPSFDVHMLDSELVGTLSQPNSGDEFE